MKIPAPSQSSPPLRLASGHLRTAEAVGGDLLWQEAMAVWQRVRLGQGGTKPLAAVREELGLGS